MDKKPLIVVSICAVVLLVMGSLSNVVGAQEVNNSKNGIDVGGDATSPSMKNEGFKLLNLRVKTAFYYGYELFLVIQNNGTETINYIHGHGEYIQVFKPKVHYNGSIWLYETFEPGETFIVGAFYMPLNMWTKGYFRINISVESDVPSYNHIIINDRYCFGLQHGNPVLPMHGILDWLADLLGLP